MPFSYLELSASVRYLARVLENKLNHAPFLTKKSLRSFSFIARWSTAQICHTHSLTRDPLAGLPLRFLHPISVAEQLKANYQWTDSPCVVDSCDEMEVCINSVNVPTRLTHLVFRIQKWCGRPLSHRELVRCELVLGFWSDKLLRTFVGLRLRLSEWETISSQNLNDIYILLPLPGFKLHTWMILGTSLQL